MRAVVHTRYGSPDVLRVAEVERPTPGEDEVLIKIHASTVNRTDCGFRKPEPFFVRLFSGLLRPKKKILGTELSGQIVEVGVTEIAVGDAVFGVRADEFGTRAEYVCMSESAPLATRPPDGPDGDQASLGRSRLTFCAPSAASPPHANVDLRSFRRSVARSRCADLAPSSRRDGPTFWRR